MSLILTLASCQYQSSDMDPTLRGFFPNDNQPAKPAQFADVQAARGARCDGMLHKQHFDGAQLNSLGEEKLDLMLKSDAAANPMVVYLTLAPASTDAKPRQEAVATYLRDKGLKASQIDVRVGANPDSRNPAAPRITQFNKLETAATTADSGASSPSAASGGSGSAVSSSIAK